MTCAGPPRGAQDAGDLRVADLFLVKYNEQLGQTALRQHQDKGIISVNVALNPSDQFEEVRRRRPRRVRALYLWHACLMRAAGAAASWR